MTRSAEVAVRTPRTAPRGDGPSHEVRAPRSPALMEQVESTSIDDDSFTVISMKVTK